MFKSEMPTFFQNCIQELKKLAKNAKKVSFYGEKDNIKYITLKGR